MVKTLGKFTHSENTAKNSFWGSLEKILCKEQQWKCTKEYLTFFYWVIVSNKVLKVTIIFIEIIVLNFHDIWQVWPGEFHM